MNYISAFENRLFGIRCKKEIFETFRSDLDKGSEDVMKIVLKKRNERRKFPARENRRVVLEGNRYRKSSLDHWDQMSKAEKMKEEASNRRA